MIQTSHHFEKHHIKADCCLVLASSNTSSSSIRSEPSAISSPMSSWQFLAIHDVDDDFHDGDHDDDDDDHQLNRFV